MIELNTEEMVLNMGPQHPSTHGVLQLIIRLNGEVIKEAIPVIGYLHRSLEKLGETMNYLQYIPVLNRFDYLSNSFGEAAYVLAIEKLADIKVPEKAEYLRVIVMELDRIGSHLFWYMSLLNDIGATTPLMYTMREREKIVDILEELTGQRMMHNYFRFGGVRYDVTDGLLDKISAFTNEFPKYVNEYEILVTKNPIFLQRVENIGIIPSDLAINYGVTGPTLRGSGVKWDLRRNEPYSIYDRFDFDIPVGTKGDTLDRYLVRVEEFKESNKIIKQAVAQFPKEGPIIAKKLVPTFKPPAGEVYMQVEASRGNLGAYVISDGKTNKPLRVKLRAPSFSNLQILPEILKDCYLADIMPIFGSFDVILPEVDR